MNTDCPTCMKQWQKASGETVRARVLEIVAESARLYGVPASLILGRPKPEPVSYARQMAFLVARQTVPWATYHAIAKVFDRHHVTVMHGVQAATDRINIERVHERVYEQMMKKFSV